VGNSDLDDGDASLFGEFLGARTFRFEYGGCLFLLLDNAEGLLTPGAVAGLKDRLERSRGRYRRVFVALHRPLIGYTYWWHGEERRQNEHGCEEVLDVLRRRPVDYVLAGHLHGYARKVVDGSIHLITGGGGGVLQTPDAEYHFVEMRVAADGTVTEEKVSIGRERSAWDQALSDWHTKWVAAPRERPLRWGLLEIAAVLGLAACLLGGRRPTVGDSPADSSRRLGLAAVALTAAVGTLLLAAGASAHTRGGDADSEDGEATEARVQVVFAEEGDLATQVRVVGRVAPAARLPAGSIPRLESGEESPLRDAGGIVVSFQLAAADACGLEPRAVVHVDLGEGKRRVGRIQRIAESTDPETGLIQVEVACEPQLPSLPPGTAVVVGVETGPKAHGWLLPASAVSAGESGYSVVQVDEEGIAHIVAVRVLARSGDRVAVAGDLPGRPRIAVEGNFNLPEGCRVVPEPAR